MVPTENPPAPAVPGLDLNGQGPGGPTPGAAPMGDMMDFGGRGMGGPGGNLIPSDSVRYGVIWFPTVRLDGQPGNFWKCGGEDLSFSHPLWTDGHSSWSITGRGAQPAHRHQRHPAEHGPARPRGTLGHQPWSALRAATGQRLDDRRRPELWLGEPTIRLPRTSA